MSSFERAGIYPLNAERFLSKARPKGVTSAGKLASPEALIDMMKMKRDAARESMLGKDVHVASCGFVYTVRGAVLNSENTLKMTEKKSLIDEKKRHNRKYQPFVPSYVVPIELPKQKHWRKRYVKVSRLIEPI